MIYSQQKVTMTEQMKIALDKAAAGLQWSNGQILLHKDTLQPADPATTPLDKLVSVPVPDKLYTAVHFGAKWYVNNLWHDIDEVPEYTEGDDTANQIIVFGKTRTGKGCSIASMIAEGILYAPVSGMTYKWGDCPFVKWAYAKDILTDEMMR